MTSRIFDNGFFMIFPKTEPVKAAVDLQLLQLNDFFKTEQGPFKAAQASTPWVELFSVFFRHGIVHNFLFIQGFFLFICHEA